jgi:hypothetical protein
MSDEHRIGSFTSDSLHACDLSPVTSLMKERSAVTSVNIIPTHRIHPDPRYQAPAEQ